MPHPSEPLEVGGELKLTPEQLKDLKLEVYSILEEQRVDTQEYLKVESVVIPPVARPGARVRIRFICVLRGAAWNDEGEPLSITVNGKVTEADLVGGSGEVRLLECEVEVPADGSKISAYAAFDICVKKTGVCCYLRKDLKIPLKVDAKAQQIR